MNNLKFIPSENFRYLGKFYYKNKDISEFMNLIIFINPFITLIFVGILEFAFYKK